MSKIEKSVRVKYLRGLERAARSLAAQIKREDFSAEKFLILQEKMRKFLNNIEAAFLDSAYPKSLENFVQDALDEKYSLDKLRASYNELERLKNKRFKKDKHKNWSDDDY